MLKNKTENKTVEIIMDTLDIQTDIIIPGMKLRFLSTKNEYGTFQLFKYWVKNNFKKSLN